ncbi:MAG: biotin carboxylase N-terminal domain-containing protein [Pseudomonadota bacterium]
MKKLLIANRGEIASRIITTATRMGVRTVAIYADDDAQAPFVALADQAASLQATTASDSYLNIERIINIARTHKVDAIHPGYGFLSENPDFAQACQDQNITFIGPSPQAIRLMGDKIQAKTLARNQGIATVSGDAITFTDARKAQAQAKAIGYPVILKAAAGGGGRGMRVVKRAADFAPAFNQASAEALTGFSDPRMFVEAWIEKARHIEVQILADQQGTILPLGERECSLQRRHQKIIEQAPSPFLTDETRQALFEASVRLARAAKYTNAGTVEFLVDQKQNFYFLEINARLQVEHPVTEQTWGLDLVEWMIRVTRGESLPKDGDFGILPAGKASGYAIEARVCAEDPRADFMPTIGQIRRIVWPEACAFTPFAKTPLRIDSGLRAGQKITPHFDSMIAKVIATGKSHEQALQRLHDALNQSYIEGLQTNLVFLRSLLADPHVRRGDLHTGLIAQIDTEKPLHPYHLAAIAAAWGEQNRRLYPAHQAPDCDDVILQQDDKKPITARIRYSDDSCVVTIKNKDYEITGTWTLPFYCVQCDGKIFYLVREENSTWQVGEHRGIVRIAPAHIKDYARIKPAANLAGKGAVITAPMPGLVHEILIEKGQSIHKGSPVIVIESMKMYNTITSEIDGEVVELCVKAGQEVPVSTPLVRLKPA